MANAQYPNLKRKKSRWQTRPFRGEEDDSDTEVDDTRASLLLFLRDLDTDEAQWDDLIQGFGNVMAAQDVTSNSYAVLRALLDCKDIAYDYIKKTGPRGSRKRRRLRLIGNSPEAERHFGEHDELIDLARTVWTDPDDLGDVIGDLYAANMNPQPPDQQPSLQDIFGWARSWGEVRYRFMNHALKDDPYEWQNFASGLALNKGNAANGLVHNSNVLEDCRLVELSRVGGHGFSNVDRQLFQSLYLLAPAEGQQLIQYTGQATGLRAGLPEVFRFCVKLIDAYMNWRIQVLMSARQQILRDPSVRNAPTDRVRTNAMTLLYNANKTRLQAADNAYGIDFLSALRTLLNEAATLDAFNKSSYDALDIAQVSVTRELRGCLLNTNNAALRNQVNNFPGANVQLRAPTGTSIISRRRRLNR